MDNPNIGGIIGSVVGILGGMIGTYFSIRNTKSPRERRFAIFSAIVVWFALGLTVLAAFLVPPLRAWVWVPLCIMVIIGVPLINRRQEAIRREDGPK